MQSHKTSKYLTSRALLGATAFVIGMATQPAWSGVISYNFSENPANQQLDTTTPKGPLNTTFWNDSNTEGAPGAGTESALVNETGAATTAAITWNSSNTWYNGSGAGSENARIVVGYLDDGGSGVNVNITNIPYAKYNVYGIVGSDQTGDNYTTVDFNVNGQWVFPVAQPQLTNSGSAGAAGNSELNTAAVNLTPGALAGSTDPAFSYTAQLTRIPYSAALNPAGSFTVECWINPADVGAGNRVLVQSMINGQNPSNADDRTGWVFRQNGDQLTFVVGGTGPLGGSVFYTSTVSTPTGAIVAGTWQHVVAVYNSATLNISIFVNGTKLLDTTAAAPLIPNFAAPVLFGDRGYGGWAYSGGLDEVAIYPSALSDATIASHTANGTNASRPTPYQTLVMASSPVGYWRGATFSTFAAGTAPAFSNWISAGEQWTRIIPGSDQRGNYWKLSGVTGSTLNIQGQPRSGSNRGSLSAIMIEEFFVPDKLVKTGIDTFAEVALGAGLTSEFRPKTDQATVTTPNALSIAATHNISIIPELATPSGTYKLIDYSGSIAGAGFAGLALTPLGNSRYGMSLVHNTADTSIDLVYTAPDAVVWTGDQNGTWDTAGALNWKPEGGSTPTTYQPFDFVKFDDSAETKTINITGGAKAPISMEFFNNTNFSIGGDPITGGTDLIKDGEGTLSLLNENTFTGKITVVQGKLKVGDGTTGSISSTAPVYVTGGSELELNLPADGTYAGNVVNEGTSFIKGTGSATLSGTFSGGGLLELDRAGDVTMSGAGHLGGIVVKNGTALKVTGGSWPTSFFGNGARSISIEGGGSMETGVHSLGGLGGALYQPTITIEEGGVWTMLAEQYLDAGNLALFGGTLQIQSNDLRMYPGVLGAGASTTGSTINGGTLNLFGDVSFSVEDGAAANDLTINSAIVENGGARSITKLDAGTLALTGAISITGTTTLTEGTLTGDAALTGPISTAAGTTLAPGVDIGTMSAGSAVLGGTLKIEFDGSASPAMDSLAVSGALDVTGSTLTFVSTGAALTADVYPVATAGSVTGTFATVTGKPAGYNVTYQAGGIYLLKAGVNPYNNWASSPPNSLTGNDALPTADPDKDGLANAIEFVIGGNPKAGGDNDMLPMATVQGDYLVFNFPRSDASLLYSPSVAYGSDLTGWTTAVNGSPTATPVLIETADDAFGPGLDAITVRVPMALASGNKIFARLNVTIP